MTHNPPELQSSRGIDPSWRPLLRMAGAAALVMALIIPIQSFVYIAYPPPATAQGFFALFGSNPLLGLLSLDLLYVVDNFLLVFLYLGLFVSLKPTNLSFATIALTLGLVGIAAYFSSNPGFEMLSMSRQYAQAASQPRQAELLAAAQSMLSTYTGTAFDVYYVFNALALLSFSVVMLRSPFFVKANAYLGILSGILMLVPSTAGATGLYFASASIPPWFLWLILYGIRLLRT
jgi:hypothetical protein